MVVEVSIDINRSDYAIAGDMIRIRVISKMTSISDPAIAAPIPLRKFIVYLLSQLNASSAQLSQATP
jgi:hypothetical protein